MKKNQDLLVDAVSSADSPGSPQAGRDLRRQAEERLSAKQKGRSLKTGDQPTVEDPAGLIHELQVYQIELEMQNEELQQERVKANALLAQYTDLYDFAPAGYLTLDREGTILRVNLTGARLLGVERSRLVSRRFGQFVAESDRRAFSDFLERICASEGEKRGGDLTFDAGGNGKESCEVTLSREGSPPLVVRIEGIRTMDGQECGAVMSDITSKVRADEAFRASLSHQEALLSTIPDIVMEVDCNKIYTWANPAGLQFFGEDVIGKEAASYFEGEQDTYQAVAPLFKGEEHVFYIESWQRRHDGQKRLLAWGCRTLKDAHGVVIGALSTARDITEQMRVKAALAESEEKLRALFETMSEGIVYEDHDGKIISANPAAERLLGLSLDQMQGRTSIDPRWKAIHEDGSPFPGETHSLRVAAMTGKAATGEVQGIYNPKSGAYIWLSINSTPEFRPGEKKPFRAYAVFRDITERKRADALLAEHQILLQNLIESPGEAIFSVDRDYLYTSFNAQHAGIMKTIYGVDIQLGKSLLDYQRDTGDHVQAKRNLDRAFAGERFTDEGFSGEDARTRAYFEVSHGPVHNQVGEIVGVSVFARDTTTRKQAEDTLRQQSETLRDRNEELEQFNRAMVGRELRMIELKEEINELCRRLGEPPRHATDQLQSDSVAGAGPAPAPPGGGGYR